MKEVWKLIDKLGNAYVSNIGNVKVGEKLVRKRKSPQGYLRCSINGKTEYIHRLVAMAFVKNHDVLNKNQVNHIDGNKLNNRADNLEWCTQRENNIHKAKLGRNNNNLKPVPVIGINAKDNEIRVFRSEAEASRYVNGKSRGVAKAVSGELRTYYGWIFKKIGLNSVDGLIRDLSNLHIA